MSSHNVENCEKLAREVVNGMEMDDLISYAIMKMSGDYIKDEEMFEDEWPIFFGK